MKSTVFATLIFCLCLIAGCESLNRLARKPGESLTGSPEKLALDAKRRQAAEEQAARNPQKKPSTDLAGGSGARQANFPPAGSANDGDLDSILAQANHAERANQIPAAKALYEQALQISPQNAQSHHRLGVLADQLGRYDEAQNHYQVALSQEPNNPVLLSDIGYSYYSQDRLDEAEQYLLQSLQVQPNNEIARNNLGQVYGKRALQTGSQKDYQLAREQFAMASGPEAAEEQMRAITSGNSDRSVKEERHGVTNPFKKRNGNDKSMAAQSGSGLQAPDPAINKETRKFMQKLESMKKEAIANGEIKPPANSGNPQALRDPNRGNPYANVPTDRLNDELAQIDRDAALRRERALQVSNSLINRPTVRHPILERNVRGNAPFDQRGDIEQTGGWDDGSGSQGQHIQGQNLPNINPLRTRQPRVADAQADDGSDPPASSALPSGRGQNDPRAQYQEGPADYPRAPGAVGDPRFGDYDPAANQNWNGRPPSDGSQPWPESSRTGHQFDSGAANDNRIDAAGTQRQNDENRDFRYTGLATQPRNPFPFDPTNLINREQQRPDVVQAPPGWGVNRGTSNQGGRFSNQYNYGRPDDGRQTAAELGLDAGVGEMFPNNALEQISPNNRRQGRAPYGPRKSVPDPRTRQQTSDLSNSWSAFDSQNQGVEADATTRRGMPQGGNGTMAPADYAPQQTGFRNGGYPRGAEPGEFNNAGAGSGSDAGQSYDQGSSQDGMAPQNTGRPRRPDYNSVNGRPSSSYPPSRPNSAPPQNFGTPPMYFGR
jgi:Flp pilus assembly protein TadD